MSKYDGIYKCGHSGTIDICGPTRDRDRIRDYRFGGDCPQCWGSEQKIKREVQRKNNIVQASMLPLLTGSDKQIAWAIQIRAEKIKAGISPYTVQNETTVRYWIDNRMNMTVGEIFGNLPIISKYP